MNKDQFEKLNEAITLLEERHQALLEAFYYFQITDDELNNVSGG